MPDLFKSYAWWVIILAIIAGFVYSSIYWTLRPAVNNGDQWIFNTPDETANYFFTSLFSQTQNLSWPESLNAFSALDLVHPRGITVKDNNLVPGSFLGFIIIIGSLANVWSVGLIPFMTPLLSVLATICFFWLLKEVFSPRIAFISSLLLLLLPAWWYYNARSLFPNIIFLDLLIIGLYLIWRFVLYNNIIYLAVGSLAVGLALTIRTTEIIWVVLLIVISTYINRRKVGLRYLWLTLLIIGLAFLPVLIWQNYLFGNPLTVGYVPEGWQQVGNGSWWWGLTKSLLIPHGFNLTVIVYNLYFYFAKMFWWQFILSAAGLVLLLYHWSVKKLSYSVKVYFLASGLVYLVVILYYGSWFFYNNTMKQALIGSSQVRYFLPLYLLAIPLAAYFIDWLIELNKNLLARVVIVLIIFGSIITLAIRTTLIVGPESLLAVQQTVKNYYQINQQVRRVTEEESVIVSSYSDKVFFPGRKVIFYWQEPRFLAEISQLSRQAPIYFYSINPAEIIYIKDNSDLKPVLVQKINSSESLYKLNPPR